MVSISREEYERIVSKNRNAAWAKEWLTPESIAKKESKYHNVAVTTAHGKFHSIRESKRYDELFILQRCGVISELRRQVPFRFVPAFYLDGKWEPGIEYRADFVYVKDGNTVVEDSKGARTDVFKLKRQLLLFKYPEVIFIET